MSCTQCVTLLCQFLNAWSVWQTPKSSSSHSLCWFASWGVGRWKREAGCSICTSRLHVSMFECQKALSCYSGQSNITTEKSSLLFHSFKNIVCFQVYATSLQMLAVVWMCVCVLIYRCLAMALCQWQLGMDMLSRQVDDGDSVRRITY